MKRSMTRRRLLVTTGVILLGSGLATVAKAKEPSGSVTIDETQIAFIVSGVVGGGKLYFREKTYDFKIGGFGIGGIGGSSIRAVGEVYDLRNVNDFPGVYGEARAGYAVGRQSAGHLWLQNPNNVVLHLRAAREGLILSLGADGVVVSMD
jgi:hypothetical protein